MEIRWHVPLGEGTEASDGDNGRATVGGAESQGSLLRPDAEAARV